MKKIIIFISLALSILSCEEIEVDIQKANSTDFSITANVNQESLLVNEKFEFNLFIEAITPITEELDYSLKFFDTGINGELSINGIVYQEGERIPNISPGTTVVDYIGNEVGSGTITFQVTASNDLVKSIPITISIQKTDFDFEVLFDRNENYINEKTSFNINLEKRGSEPLTFKTYFKNIEGEITLDDQGESIFQNRMFDISEGITFGEFKGTLIQEGNIEFVIEASNGITKSQIINFKTLLTDFEVVMTPNPMVGSYLSDLDFTYFIKRPDNLEQEIEYYLHITSVGLGRLMYNISGSNDNIQQGFEWNIGNRISNGGKLKQLGVSSPRSGVVTFHYRDSNGATYEKSITVDYQ